MALSSQLLRMLCCPESHQSLREIDATLLDQFNARVQSNELVSTNGEVVTETLDGGLLREDGKILYAIREEIPVLLVEEGIQVPGDLVV